MAAPERIRARSRHPRWSRRALGDREDDRSL